jgi:hypothetical protein
MKIGLSASVAFVLLSSTLSAAAQSPPVAAPAQPTSPVAVAVPEAPTVAGPVSPESPAPAALPDYVPATRAKRALSKTTGVALAFQTGYSLPSGKLTDSDTMGDWFGGQVPIWVELGFRVTPQLFIGGYGALGFGEVGGAMDTACSAKSLDCSSRSLRAGFAVRYRYFATETIHPWLGYAAGYESNSAVISAGSAEGVFNFTGWELAHLSAGIDVSDGELFGVGPVVDYGIGQYNHVSYEETGRPSADNEIAQTATHQWVTFGLRLTIMP